MNNLATLDDVYGFIRPGVDAHTLGISAVENMLHDCGFTTVTAGAEVCRAANNPRCIDNVEVIVRWIRANRITRIGFSYRLDPDDGARTFGHLLHLLRERRLLASSGGQIAAVYFAGLPDACRRVKQEHAGEVEVFLGDETCGETLARLGVPESRLPGEVAEDSRYDQARMDFARSLLERCEHEAVQPQDRSGYPTFGTSKDRLVDRVRHGSIMGLDPVMRAHVGPYGPDRLEAVKSYIDWTHKLAASGYLDVLSIGSSQLTQSHFEEDWTGLKNGGGVPLNSRDELRSVWEAARPMLVRAYAGCRDVCRMAKINEETLNIAWHALSFWWFSEIDGRGPNSVRQNLEEHVDTLRYIAATDKPFEPNIPHHFGFRGSDDISYIVSGVLAARTAKAMGVRHFVLQTMLNTPKQTWGIQDLAKSRALLSLTRSLEDESFHVMHQPRAGLDYFSHDLNHARAQLASVSALMDDIEPGKQNSPDIIHVVSYSEGSHLADPEVVDESIRITRAALSGWRQLRQSHQVEDMSRNLEVRRRTLELTTGALEVLRQIELSVDRPYTASGLYTIFRAGFLPVPWLWQCQEEFGHAVRWKTRVQNGGVVVVDDSDSIVKPADRAMVAAEVARGLQAKAKPRLTVLRSGYEPSLAARN